MSRYLTIVQETQRPPAPLPTVAALEALWGEVSRRPLWAPPTFWRWVALRRRTKLQLIDPRRVAIAVPPGKVNDCQSCTDICCVGPRSTVLLRLRDIATLMDVRREDLIAVKKPSFSDEELRNRPALSRQVQSSAWQTFPVLRQDSMSACSALTKDGKCSLYPHWPLSCARFPYSLHADDLEVFYSRRCDAFHIRNDREADGRVHAMGLAAVAAYNERIKDLVLLAYAHPALERLGLLRFLSQPDVA